MDAVTVALLIYRSADWLDFVLEGLAYARNETPSRILVVGNDANEEVRATGRLDVDFRNPDPAEYYINRVYRAWNEAVRQARTDWVVLINSDMYVSDYWLDELVAIKRMEPKSLPCSLLVESGRIPSAMPEYVKDFGLLDQFDGEAFRRHANELRTPNLTEPGRLFMPALFERETFLDLGGYPPGNVGGVSGDRILFNKFVAAGYQWLTCLGSVVYHTQEGEMGRYASNTIEFRDASGHRYQGRLEMRDE